MTVPLLIVGRRPALREPVPHQIRELPILVLFPHNRCNCRCVMCDIWRIRQVREITSQDLAPHLESFRALRVQWVVFSGGEPLMHSDLVSLGRMLRREGVRITLLTTGLLLQAHAPLVAEIVDDVIVSLDGPPEIHNRIRRLPEAFDRLARGVKAVRDFRGALRVTCRTTVQKINARYLRETVSTAKRLGLNSVSFLAADVTSEAFNRPEGWTSEQQERVALDADEVEGLQAEMETLIQEHAEDLASGYIAETPEKLRRIVLHFRAHLGQCAPVAPPCNAPWVSAVVEADGTVRPCFFHRPLGNIHDRLLADILNSSGALEFRRQLDIPNNPTCQRCVCSLNFPVA